MTHRMGTKGQVVIPKSLRDELGFTPGTEIEFERNGDRIEIGRSRDSGSLRGILSGTNALKDLELDHARERK